MFQKFMRTLSLNKSLNTKKNGKKLKFVKSNFNVEKNSINFDKM